MKTRNLSSYLFLLLICILIIGCNKDDDELIPEPIATPTDIGLGVRLSIDSIVCLASEDEINNATDNSEIEVYGYIRAWSDFEYPEAIGKENYEKVTTSMLWFRDFDDWIRLKSEDVVKVGKFTDFFYDNDKPHLAHINFDFFFLEYDSGEDTWRNSSTKDQIMYTEEIDDENERIISPISISMEDIEYYDRVFQKTYTQHVRNNCQGDDADMQLEIHYSFHPIPIKSVASLPEGYTMEDEIIEPDLFPDIPTVSAYADAPSARSEELVVGQKVLSKFSPEPMMVKLESGYYYYVYGLNPKFVSGSQLQDPFFDPVERPNNGEDDPWNGLLNLGDIAIKATDRIIGPRLLSKPIIQMIRYWVPINVERIPAGVTLTTSTQITHGVGAEVNYEYSITTGITASTGLLSFNQQISQTFGFTLSYNYSITTTKSKEIAAPDDKNVSYITWQLVEEIKVVDENGEMFTDPNYDFKSMLIATIPTDHIVEEAHQFSAF